MEQQPKRTIDFEITESSTSTDEQPRIPQLEDQPEMSEVDLNSEDASAQGAETGFPPPPANEHVQATNSGGDDSGDAGDNDGGDAGDNDGGDAGDNDGGMEEEGDADGLGNDVRASGDDAQGGKAPKRTSTAIFRSLQVPKKNRAALTWEGVTCTVFKDKNDTEGKRILDDLSGAVRPGETCALMGPSGSGKTTMLDFLADRKKDSKKQRLKGTVLVNGQPRGTNFRHYAAYVQQEDTLIGTLTVLETFLFSAALTMRGKTEEERRATVADALSILGLSHCQDVAIGNVFKKGVSGGQKRRVSIGIELLKNPTLMFLDEPTSGLDSEAALNIVIYLRKLADTGRSVLFTIHQPNSGIYAQFAKLIILTRGSMVYNGKASEAVSYFAGLGYELPPYTNPADYFLSLVNTDFEDIGEEDRTAREQRQQHFVQMYQQSQRKRDVEKEISELTAQGGRSQEDTSVGETHKGYAAPFLTQLYRLCKRRNTDNVRNPGVFWVRLAMFFILCFLIGTTYWQLGDSFDRIQDRISMLFFTAAFLVFMSIAVVPMFIEDRAVFVRERRNGYYYVAAPVLADTIMSIPGLLIISFVSSVMIFFMAGLYGGAAGFFIFMFALFVSLFVAESMLAFIASLVPHYIIGMALGAGVYGFFMLTEGFFILPKDIPPYWIWGFYIGFHRYSFRIFMHNEFSGNTFNSTRLPTGEDVLAIYDMEDVNVGEDFAILIAMAIIYRLLFFTVLFYFRKGKQ